MTAFSVQPDGSLRVGNVVIPDRELTIRVTTSGGPGGQHANRTMSRVVVTFDPATSSVLSEAQRTRLGERHDGPYVATSSEHRSQRRNKEAALERLAELIASGLAVPKSRRATKPTRGSVRERVASKRHRAERKQQRRRPSADD